MVIYKQNHDVVLLQPRIAGVQTVHLLLKRPQEPGQCDSEVENRPMNQEVRVLFRIRAHAWVAGTVPSRGHIRGSHTVMLSHH